MSQFKTIEGVKCGLVRSKNSLIRRGDWLTFEAANPELADGMIGHEVGDWTSSGRAYRVYRPIKQPRKRKEPKLTEREKLTISASFQQGGPGLTVKQVLAMRKKRKARVIIKSVKALAFCPKGRINILELYRSESHMDHVCGIGAAKKHGVAVTITPIGRKGRG